MLRFFRVKRDCIGQNPLNDTKGDYYEEVSSSGLQPNERALKVCYQNGDILQLKNFTTATEEVDINKVLNSTLYNFEGAFYIKTINDSTAPEYLCFQSINKAHYAEDNYYLLWLTVYEGVNGTEGFKICLKWDFTSMQFFVVTNPVKIVLDESDDINKVDNKSSIPTVAVLHKWEYQKKWYEINTPNRKGVNGEGAAQIVNEVVNCPIEPIEIYMPTEEQIYKAIQQSTGIDVVGGEADFLSMDFGTQVGYNGYNTCQIAVGYSTNPITDFNGMKKLKGQAWLSVNPQTKTNILLSSIFYPSFRIHDKNGNPIKHPLNSYLYDNVTPLTIYGKLNSDLKEYYEMTDEERKQCEDWYWAHEVEINKYRADSDTFWNCIQCNSYAPFFLGCISQYPAFPICAESKNTDGSWTTTLREQQWRYDLQIIKNDDFYQPEKNYAALQNLPPNYDKNPLLKEPENYMPIWDRFFINFYTFSRSRDGTKDSITLGKEFYVPIKNAAYKSTFYAYNSHVQLKYLLGRWVKKGL